MTETKLSPILIGVAGEYFVAAELSRMGYIASITLRNTEGIDILAANGDGTKSVSIQVKTNGGERRKWMLNSKAENMSADQLFYVFVSLGAADNSPAYHVVPSKVVAERTATSHRAWLEGTKRDGTSRKDSSMRKFEDPTGEFLDAWDKLGLG